MLSGVLVLTIVGCLWGVLGVVISRMRDKGLAFVACTMLSSLFTATIAWSIFPGCPQPPQNADWQPIFWLGAVLGSAEILRISGLLLVQRAMKTGHNGQAWIVAQASFVIPLGAGILFFGEALSLPRGLGVLLCLASVAILGATRHTPAREAASVSNTADAAGPSAAGSEMPATNKNLDWRIFAFLAFLVLGVQQTLMTVPSYWSVPPEILQWRIPLMLTWGTLINTLIMIKKRVRPTRALLLPAAGLALSSVAGTVLFFYGLDLLAKVQMVSLAYAITIAACILSFTLYSTLRLGEPFKLMHWAGLAGILTGLILFTL